MKRIFSLFLCILLICSMTVAFAVDEKITIDIQPVDYQTGKAVNKSYVENELFRLRVDIDVPRFMDMDNLEMLIEVDGVEIEQPIIELVTGRYYIEGIVMEQPAAICVKVMDMAYENADTAEDLYYAMKANRSVSACYNFNTAQPTVNNNLYIPKTGDYTVTGFIILGLAALAALSLWNTAKRARR